MDAESSDVVDTTPLEVEVTREVVVKVDYMEEISGCNVSSYSNANSV